MLSLTLALGFLFGMGAIANEALGATPAGVPAGFKAVAVCNDGKTYYAKTNEHRGACSGHGGVKSWADGSPVKSKSKSTYVK
jgi:hypothetical protein